MNKYIVTLFLGILFLTLPQQGAAQENNRLTKETKVAMEKLGKALNTTDSAYIEPNHYNLTFMVEQSFWQERYRLGAQRANGRQTISLAPEPTPKIGVYFGWRWIFLGVSASIPELLRKKTSSSSKKEYVFNLYSARFGVDLFYRVSGHDFKIKSYSGFNLPDDLIGQTFNGLHTKMLGLNTYWIFNNKRFSYPAAYSQSTNQKRSCGSFMAGMSYSHHNISFDYTLLPEAMQPQIRPSLQFNNLKYDDYNISFGYGYNWVFTKNCLFNLSAMPALAYKRAKLDGDIVNPNENNDMFNWMKNVNFDVITRAAMTWNTGKYYAGVIFVLNTFDYRKKSMSMTNSFGSLRLYLGFNFWKKREYRQK